MLLYGSPLKLDLLVSLIVEGHFVGSLIPVSIDDNEVFTRIKVEMEGQTFSFFVFACNPSITIGSIFAYYHDPSPRVLVTIVVIILFIFLDETYDTVYSSLSDCKFSQRNAVDILFY